MKPVFRLICLGALGFGITVCGWGQSSPEQTSAEPQKANQSAEPQKTNQSAEPQKTNQSAEPQKSKQKEKQTSTYLT
jgi:hypothetical protein